MNSYFDGILNFLQQFVTSTLVLYRTLKLLAFLIFLYQPTRFYSGYPSYIIVICFADNLFTVLLHFFSLVVYQDF
uniref:7TM_GPCR_Srx domain-containing protein n=1 Tax=Heterorhabditis bacteriophora TaxID=37862 RepID=A0A1I7WWR8_HETBA